MLQLTRFYEETDSSKKNGSWKKTLPYQIVDPHLEASIGSASFVVANTDDNHNEETEYEHTHHSNKVPVYLNSICNWLKNIWTDFTLMLIRLGSIDVANVVVGPLLYSTTSPFSSMAIT